VGEGDKAAGGALVASAAGIVFAMAHHPTRLDQAGAAVTVHSLMLVLLAAMMFGFVHFARRRGLGRPAVLAGLVAYAFAVFANLGAATVNGLIVPALVMRGQGAVSADLLALTWETNQALDAIGVSGTGAAFVLWSVDLLSDRRTPARLLGAAGILVGIVSTALLASGALRMNVTGAFTIYAMEVAWAALVGLFLLRYGAARPAEA
jgi:hypothetical protein